MNEILLILYNVSAMLFDTVMMILRKKLSPLYQCYKSDNFVKTTKGSKCSHKYFNNLELLPKYDCNQFCKLHTI